MFVLFTFRSESLSIAVMLDPPLPTREELPCEVLLTSKLTTVFSCNEHGAQDNPRIDKLEHVGLMVSVASGQ